MIHPLIVLLLATCSTGLTLSDSSLVAARDNTNGGIAAVAKAVELSSREVYLNNPHRETRNRRREKHKRQHDMQVWTERQLQELSAAESTKHHSSTVSALRSPATPRSVANDTDLVESWLESLGTSNDGDSDSGGGGGSNSTQRANSKPELVYGKYYVGGAEKPFRSGRNSNHGLSGVEVNSLLVSQVLPGWWGKRGKVFVYSYNVTVDGSSAQGDDNDKQKLQVNCLCIPSAWCSCDTVEDHTVLYIRDLVKLKDPLVSFDPSGDGKSIDTTFDSLLAPRSSRNYANTTRTFDSEHRAKRSIARLTINGTVEKYSDKKSEHSGGVTLGRRNSLVLVLLVLVGFF